MSRRSLSRSWIVIAFCAIGCGRSTPRFDSLPTGPIGLVRTYEGHTDPVLAVAFSPDGKYMASGGGNSAATYGDIYVQLWDLKTGQKLHRFITEETIKSVVFSPDGRHLLAGTGHKLRNSPKGVTLWTVEDRRRVWFQQTARIVDGVAFSPDGAKIYAFMSMNSTIETFGRDDGRLIATTEFTGRPDTGRYFAFSPNRDSIIFGGYEAQIWDIEKGMMKRQFEPESQPNSNRIWTAAYSPNGKLIATGCGHWKNEDGKPRYFDCSIRIWDAETGKELRRLEGHTDFVRCVAFTPDSQRLVSASGNPLFKTGPPIGVDYPGVTDTSLRVWNVTTGEQLHGFEGHTAPVLSIAISPDGKNVLSGSEDKTVKLWRIAE